MKFSDRFQFFMGVSALLFLANLFIMNDYATLWNGPEAALLWDVDFGLLNSLPHLLTAALYDPEAFNLFVLRLPGPILLCLAFGIYYLLGKRIFGRTQILFTLLILGASFMMPVLAKRNTADLWLWFAQLFTLLALLRFLKQTSWLWQILFYLGLLVAVVLQPLGSTLLFFIIPTALYFYHPQGKNLMRLAPWIAALGLFALSYFLNPELFNQRTFEIGWRSSSFGKYLLVNILGVLPFVGFLLAGIRETIFKLKRGEELAIINSAIGLGAIFSQSVLLQLLFAFLIAKQMQSFFVKNYPYQNIVKSGAILHLLLTFGLAFLLMVGGFFEFRGPGFRAGLALGGLYWMLSFVSVIGLYGMNRRFVIGGTIMGGLLAMMVFWLQVYPLWESKRAMQLQLDEVVSKYENMDKSGLLIYKPESAAFPNLAFYGKQHFLKVAVVNDSIELERSVHSPNILLDDVANAKLPDNIQTDTIRGWNDRLRPVEYFFMLGSGTLIDEKEQNQQD
jgi:4-amino-4-deoxy-L-arabinose transferase-like glycosyltransferase